MPPARTSSTSPTWMRLAARIAAIIPEPHTLFTVRAPAVTGTLAPMATWRAGAWPSPADRTLPKIASSTCPGSTPPRRSASAAAMLPSCVAGIAARLPLKLPMGVLAAPTMRTSCIALSSALRFPGASVPLPLRAQVAVIGSEVCRPVGADAVQDQIGQALDHGIQRVILQIPALQVPHRTQKQQAHRQEVRILHGKVPRSIAPLQDLDRKSTRLN